MNSTIAEPIDSNTNVDHRTNAWESVEAAITKHHHNPDLQAARLLYSAIAAHYLEGPPVWAMLVAPPGSMKTELLNGMDGVEQVHFIDQLTPKTFISGQLDDGLVPRRESPSLLHRIGKSGIIVYPDFSTVLGMKRDDKASILADMRRIYDGKLSKEYGTAENKKERTWEGRLSFVVAVTPAIDGYYSVFQTLGERFVMVRWPRAGGIETALVAMNQNNAEAKRDLRAAVHNLLGGLPKVTPVVPDAMQVRIGALTEIAVRGRTHVPRVGYHKEIIYIPEPESATRLAQQLAQLAKGSALLANRPEVNEEDFSIVQRAAFDSMPPTRKMIIQALIQRGDLGGIKLPKATLHYAVEELVCQDLLETEPIRLSGLAAEMIRLADLTGRDWEGLPMIAA